MMNYGFAPVYDKDSEILILGSFPSIKSREVCFYYGNKQNRFWKMLEYTFNEKIEDDIQFKKQFLLSKHIALWDIFSSSDIKKSDDKSLKNDNNEIIDIQKILPPNTKIKKIICNGKLAYETLLNNFNLDIEIVYMQSTSPANPRFNKEIWKNEILKK